jgi:hypothetical protein
LFKDGVNKLEVFLLAEDRNVLFQQLDETLDNEVLNDAFIVA